MEAMRFDRVTTGPERELEGPEGATPSEAPGDGSPGLAERTSPSEAPGDGSPGVAERTGGAAPVTA